jgi:hypothetical protein
LMRQDDPAERQMVAAGGRADISFTVQGIAPDLLNISAPSGKVTGGAEEPVLKREQVVR